MTEPRVGARVVVVAGRWILGLDDYEPGEPLLVVRHQEAEPVEMPPVSAVQEARALFP